ncbi:ATP-binding cassette transporter [Rhizoctonia solani AG-1 IA]|uniref:ATP-binding cassette transporter n=1 Tax=Thanatephorus cucumeris (strain AG1-IA) TaxID=983506 RepID=L8X6Z5_THACA|nr:ATP-binding cassette transporter [Rhizoctonia solani AG-1 IA]
MEWVHEMASVGWFLDHDANHVLPGSARHRDTRNSPESPYLLSIYISLWSYPWHQHIFCTSSMSQLVLSETALATPQPKWAHGLLIPIACALVSIVLLLLRVVLSTAVVKHFIAKLRGQEHHETDVDSAPQQPVVRQHTGFFPDLHSHIKVHGGFAVFAWKILRLLACLTLTGLTVGAIVSITEGHNTIGTKQYEPVDDPYLSLDMDVLKKARGSKDKKHRKRERWFSTAYATLLAILALTLAPRFRAAANAHLVVLLLIAFAVYVWRDLVPFATYELHPADAAGGWLTWTRIGVLGFASVVIPLFIPRIYVDLRQNPSESPNPEQTASLISLLLYQFMDPLVWTAYRVPKLEYEQLPPLADYDRASHLKERSFSKLDPLRQTKRRYFFWGLMAVFWREYIMMLMWPGTDRKAGTYGVCGSCGNKLYLTSPSDPDVLRPWFWVLWLLLGPIIASIAFQWYIFIKMGSVVRAIGMISQLLFEHSLRIRMVAQVAGGSTSKTPSAVTPTIDAASIAENEQINAENSGGLQTAEEQETDSTNHTAETSNAQTLVASTSSVKGQDKVDDKSKEEGSGSSNLVGKINNLMSTVSLLHDTEGKRGLRSENRTWIMSQRAATSYSSLSLVVPIFTSFTSSVIGMAFMVLSFPIPGKLAQLVNNVQTERMKKTDERVQAISEILNVIRMVKLFGWENKVIAQVEEKRRVELEYYKKKQWIGQIGQNVNHVLPLIMMALTFACHTLWFKQKLTASIVFSSIGVFDVLRNQLHILSWEIPVIVQAKVSVDRVDEFLHQTELLDAYTHKHTPAIIDPSPPPPDAIGFRNATFAWSRQAPATPTPSRRNFRLHIDQELLFHRGKINMVVGPTGCGKTSLLMALLGEMHFVPSAPDSWFSLPRQGGIAYAAQEDNILLGAEYDEERYKKGAYSSVSLRHRQHSDYMRGRSDIAVCAGEGPDAVRCRRPDRRCVLTMSVGRMQASDTRSVGEKGMTLSGGQKARVSLARAIYSKADIIILDDVLSALDVHTSRWIVDHCFRGELVAGRTMIIVVS